MENNLFDQLIKIYNTLLMVSTKGEDTVIMGQCLTAMNLVLNEMQSFLTTNSNEE